MQPTRLVLAILILLAPALAMRDTVFCMITASRPESYLQRAVTSLLDQNVMVYDGSVLVVVDVDGGAINSSWAVPVASREIAKCDSPDTEGVPSCEVRQRSLDVISAITLCAQSATGWVILIEDDCIACPYAIDELVTTLSQLDTRETSMARFSKFQRATAVPSAKVSSYAGNIRSRLYTHPHDVTRIEDWDPPGRLYVHNRNLFHHIGRVSTEALKNSEAFREQYSELREDVCWQPDF